MNDRTKGVATVDLVKDTEAHLKTEIYAKLEL